eukprot:TRINITY_DN1404_c0_g1_i2.p1 TRINITY_DN1404_c0_g1~~TRINITY_DN1404_c0_g1_i2.p1  ORF type:complete len:376 (-),score=119.83 TRINITY_DN1404_c0_g1_i2:87-1214(-)
MQQSRRLILLKKLWFSIALLLFFFTFYLICLHSIFGHYDKEEVKEKANLFNLSSTSPSVSILLWDNLEGYLNLKELIPHVTTQKGELTWCKITTDRSKLKLENEIDAFLMHPPTHNFDDKYPFSPNLYSILFTREAKSHYRYLQDPEFAKKIDFEISYKLNATVTYGYCQNWHKSFEWLYNRETVSVNASGIPTLFVSNCGQDQLENSNHRTEFIKELLQHLEIKSYGRCFNNQPTPPEGRRFTDTAEGYKYSIISKHKFHLAFENIQEEDYVTEKIWQSFESGSIPIYWGAPNIDAFIPSKNSIIRADHFSPKVLAQYIKLIDSNKELYDEFFTWKKQPIPESFIKIQNSICGGVHELCHKIRDAKIAKINNNK